MFSYHLTIYSFNLKSGYIDNKMDTFCENSNQKKVKVKTSFLMQKNHFPIIIGDMIGNIFSYPSYLYERHILVIKTISIHCNEFNNSEID